MFLCLLLTYVLYVIFLVVRQEKNRMTHSHYDLNFDGVCIYILYILNTLETFFTKDT
jgi:hypothetical protein